MSAEESTKPGASNAPTQAAGGQTDAPPPPVPAGKLPPERRPEYILTLASLLKRPLKEADLKRVCLVATNGANDQWLAAVTSLLSHGYLQFANPDRESDGFVITPRGQVEAERRRDYTRIVEEIRSASGAKPKG